MSLIFFTLAATPVAEPDVVTTSMNFAASDAAFPTSLSAIAEMIADSGRVGCLHTTSPSGNDH